MYAFDGETTTDSTLYKLESYNEAGRRTSVKIFVSGELVFFKEFAYLYDTIKVEERQYTRTEQLLSKTAILYNDLGQESEIVEYTKKGQLTGYRTRKIYDRHNRIKAIKSYSLKGLIGYKKYKYHKNGQKKSVETAKPKRFAYTIFFDEQGNELSRTSKAAQWVVEDIAHPKGAEAEARKSSIVFNDYTCMATSKGELDLDINDKFVSETYYHVNGLKDRTVEYYNDNSYATEVYHYTYY